MVCLLTNGPFPASFYLFLFFSNNILQKQSETSAGFEFGSSECLSSIDLWLAALTDQLVQLQLAGWANYLSSVDTHLNKCDFYNLVKTIWSSCKQLLLQVVTTSRVRGRFFRNWFFWENLVSKQQQQKLKQHLEVWKQLIPYRQLLPIDRLREKHSQAKKSIQK